MNTECEYLKKSKESVYSANLLIDNNYFNSSVHCLYYSILQMIKHTLIFKRKFPEDLLNYELNTTYFNNTHLGLEKKILGVLEGSLPRDVNTFKDTFKSLKTARLQSDYNREEFDTYKLEKVKKDQFKLQTILDSIQTKEDED